jgi:hypothetical protein
LLQEQELMEEVNRMLELTGEDGLVVKEEV